MIPYCLLISLYLKDKSQRSRKESHKHNIICQEGDTAKTTVLSLIGNNYKLHKQIIITVTRLVRNNSKKNHFYHVATKRKGL